MANQHGIMRSGLQLVWRRQAVLWWLMAANLALGFLASLPVRAQLGFLDHSLASDALYHKFDVTRLVEVLLKPEVSTAVAFSGSLGLVLAYFLFTLFLTGGILEAFYTDRRMGTGEFFRACGEYLWRMLRLMIVFAVVLAPVLIAHSALRNWTGKLADEAPQEQLGFWVDLGATLALVLLALALRLWVDLAQIHTVAENESAVRRSLARAARTTLFARMYAIFVAINVLGSIAFALLCLIWTRLPHERVGLTLLIGELLVIVWVATRLWERAAEVAFYQRNRPAEMLATPPAPIVEETPSPSLEAPPAAV